jgi:hypothetical protein
MKFYCQRISIYIRNFLKSPSSLCSGVKDVEEYLHDTNSERNIDGNQKLVSYISGKAQSCNLHFYLCFPLFTFFAIFSFHLFCIYQSHTCDLLMKFEVLIFFSKKKKKNSSKKPRITLLLNCHVFHWSVLAVPYKVLIRTVSLHVSFTFH